MKPDEPTGIHDILNALKTESPLGRNLDEARIWEHWPDIAGVKLMPYGRPVAVREETLIIEVESAVWLHRFSYQKAEILSRANTFLQQMNVTDIFLRLAFEEEATGAD